METGEPDESQQPSWEWSAFAKDFEAVLAFSALAQVLWAFVGTVVTERTGIRTMQWALIGLWACPTPVAILCLRVRGRSWRVSLLAGAVLGLLASGTLYLLLMASLNPMP